MQTSLVVLGAVLAVLAVMGVGALARRRGLLDDGAARALSRLVADVTFPALCLDGLARSDGATVAQGWIAVGLGFGTLGLAALVGVALARAMRVPPAARPTVVFAIAIGNWIFLPLPVAEALFGEHGTTIVILNNVGAQVFLWTLGIVILRSGRFDVAALGAIVRSPGLWATLVGIVIGATGVEMPRQPIAAGAVRVVVEAMHAVAGVTIPLVSIAIGAQLASPGVAAGPGGRALQAIVLGRMLAAPLVVAMAIVLASGGLSPQARSTELLIAAMPVSLSAAALVQRYGGDTPLVSRAILVTTLLSVVTVPLWMLAFGG